MKIRYSLYVNAALIVISTLVYMALISPVSVMTASGSRAYPVYRGTGKGRISVIVAVSWDASALEGILKTLDDCVTPMTFAVTGEWAEEHPTELADIRKRGHEIAVMLSTKAASKGSDRIGEELAASLGIIERITGERPEVFLCGNGAPAVCAAAGNALGLTTVIGTAYIDCGSGSAFDIEERAVSAVQDGSIMIAEPTGGFREALPFFIEKIKNMGVTIVSIHKMLYN